MVIGVQISVCWWCALMGQLESEDYGANIDTQQDF